MDAATDADAETNYNRNGKGVVEYRNGGTDYLYVFYINDSNQLVWKKSDDAGATWTAGSGTIDSSVSWDGGYSIWFDKWTPNGTGTLIHICATNTTNDIQKYYSFDVSSDSAGTNNDVTIASSLGAISTASGGDSICVAVNGDIFVSQTNANGCFIYRSQDSGASFSAIYSGTEWTTNASSSTDQLFLLPLKTDNDIMAIFLDDSTNDTDAHRWDNSGDTWDAGGDGGVMGSTNGHNVTDNNMITVTCDNNGDLHGVYAPAHTSYTDFYYVFYDESTDTWSSELKIGENKYSGSGSDQWEWGSCGITIDDTSGAIFVFATRGEWFVNQSHFYGYISCDGGLSFSAFSITSNSDEDIRCVMMPARLNDSSSPLPILIWDADSKGLISLSGGMTFTRQTGTYVDGAGDPIQGATVDAIIRLETTDSLGIRRYHCISNAVTDASGNFTIILPNYEKENAEYQLIFDLDETDPDDDLVDASHKF